MPLAPGDAPAPHPAAQAEATVDVLSVTDERVTALDELAVEQLSRPHVRAQARLDRGWPRLVLRSGPMSMTALVTGARVSDARTGAAPTHPPVGRGEAVADLPEVVVSALAGLVRPGDRVCVDWVTRRADGPYATLPPTQRTSATITIHHANGTADALRPVPGRYRTAPRGERAL